LGDILALNGVTHGVIFLSIKPHRHVGGIHNVNRFELNAET